MTTWFTSDTHYGHSNILKYSNRPFSSVEDMNRALITLWNSRVRSTDTVYHLGDFGFAKAEVLVKILKQLHGHKHFIYGNHDKEIMNNRQLFSEPGAFESIQHYKEITVEGQRIILLHYGMRVWNRSHHGSWQLYGHSHGSLPPFNKSTDVGVDVDWITGQKYAPFQRILLKDSACKFHLDDP